MFTEISDTDYEAAIAGTDGGILICYKKLCPHCKNMEKALEKFSAFEPGAALLRMDIEENTAAAAAFGAERAPTLLVIKGGKIAATKAGLMNPKELRAWYSAA